MDFLADLVENLVYMISVAKPMMHGALYTIGLAVITIIFSVPLGLGLTFLRIGKVRILRDLTGFYVWIVRGTPLLLQLFFVYYGLWAVPVIGEFCKFDRFTAACITFGLNYAAYFCEIFRGGILSIDKGQYEAAHVLGLSRTQTVFYVIIPQMFRVALPSMGNELINLVKDTALITSIGIMEILYYAKTAVSRDVNPLAFVPAAVFYLVIIFFLDRFLKRAEKKAAID